MSTTTANLQLIGQIGMQSASDTLSNPASCLSAEGPVYKNPTSEVVAEAKSLVQQITYARYSVRGIPISRQAQTTTQFQQALKRLGEIRIMQTLSTTNKDQLILTLSGLITPDRGVEFNDLAATLWCDVVCSDVVPAHRKLDLLAYTSATLTFPKISKNTSRIQFDDLLEGERRRYAGATEEKHSALNRELEYIAKTHYAQFSAEEFLSAFKGVIVAFDMMTIFYRYMLKFLDLWILEADLFDSDFEQSSLWALLQANKPPIKSWSDHYWAWLRRAYAKRS